MNLLRGVTLLCSVALLTTSCAEREPQGLLAQFVTPPREDCTFQNSTEFRAFGLLDMSLARGGYIAGIALQSGLSSSAQTSTMGPEAGRLENNTMMVRGATVRYDVQGLDNELPSGFFQYSPVTVQPGGQGVGVVNLFPPPVLEVLRTEPFLVGSKPFKSELVRSCHQARFDNEGGWQNAPLGFRTVEILVRIQFEAQLLDGTTVLSNELLYPVRVCTGCLVQQAPACIAAQTLVGETAVLEVPCVPGQDIPMAVGMCFTEHYFVDANAASWLDECAGDPNWPPASVLDRCTCAIGDSPVLCFPESNDVADPLIRAQRLAYLHFEYAYDRVESYCSMLIDEAPIYPEQPAPVAPE